MASLDWWSLLFQFRQEEVLHMEKRKGGRKDLGEQPWMCKSLEDFIERRQGEEGEER